MTLRSRTSFVKLERTFGGQLHNNTCINSRRHGTAELLSVKLIGRPEVQQRSVANMAYSNCDTRIVDLKELKIPDHAADEDYRQIYKSYIQSTEGNARNLRTAVESVKYGIAPPVAFPTETVYGLGADATNEPAVAGIFAAKGRPNDNPLIVHVSSSQHLERIIGGQLPEQYRPLVRQHWPGPLTILLPVPTAAGFAKNVHPGQQSIGFRMPSSRFARFFIAACDRPIAGPSANSSGKPSPTTAQHVLEDMRGKINFVLDGGPCEVGVESTVVDGLHDPPLVLRPGGVSLHQLRELGGKWADASIGYEQHSGSSTPEEGKYVETINGAPRAPGMKYRHYAPRAKLLLFTKAAVDNGSVPRTVTKIEQETAASGLKVGILQCRWPIYAGLKITQNKPLPNDGLVSKDVTPGSQHLSCAVSDSKESTIMINMHLGTNTKVLAHELFGALRLLDEHKCDYIFAEAVEDDMDAKEDHVLIAAVRDRLGKAATAVVES